MTERYRIDRTAKKEPTMAEVMAAAKKPRSEFIRQAALIAATLLLLGVLVVLVIVRIVRQNDSSPPNQAPLAQGQHVPSVKSNRPSGDNSPAGKTKVASAAAIETQDLETLSGKFASSVKIVILTKKTKTTRTVSGTEALALITLINNAQNPWNWNLPADQLAAWANGPYGEFFGAGNNVNLVGLAANGFVVSLIINEQGQIIAILITTDSNLLSNDTSGNHPPDANVPPDFPKAVE